MAKKRAKQATKQLPGVEKTPPAAFVHKRRAQNRLVRNALKVSTAAEALGPIERGCEIYALSTGQFSLIDVVQHVLQATGPARVVVSTWTAAGADVDIAFRLLTDGAIESLRFIVDFSFPSRQPAYCAAIREAFGDAAIRVTKNHAKFVLIRNKTWNVVIRTSMNLNENRRLENLEVSDCEGMASFLESVCDRIFESEADGECLRKTPSQNCEQFYRSFEIERDGKSTDERRFFGDGEFDNDLRRTGVSWG